MKKQIFKTKIHSLVLICSKSDTFLMSDNQLHNQVISYLFGFFLFDCLFLKHMSNFLFSFYYCSH